MTSSTVSCLRDPLADFVVTSSKPPYLNDSSEPYLSATSMMPYFPARPTTSATILPPCHVAGSKTAQARCLKSTTSHVSNSGSVLDSTQPVSLSAEPSCNSEPDTLADPFA